MAHCGCSGTGHRNSRSCEHPFGVVFERGIESLYTVTADSGPMLPSAAYNFLQEMGKGDSYVAWHVAVEKLYWAAFVEGHLSRAEAGDQKP